MTRDGGYVNQRVSDLASLEVAVVVVGDGRLLSSGGVLWSVDYCILFFLVRYQTLRMIFILLKNKKDLKLMCGGVL